MKVRKIFSTAVTALLVVAAVGLACWFAFSAITGASLITFRTGSMTPTMPQGAIAVTLPARAADLAVGDVVTVQRAGEKLPITHRVIEIGGVRPAGEHDPELRATAPGSSAPDPASPQSREIRMQGDDNDAPDHLPYIVDHVRKVVFALPGLGAALMTLQSPIGMGALILAVGALVVWAFWPGRPDDAREPHPEPEQQTGADAPQPRHAQEVQ